MYFILVAWTQLDSGSEDQYIGPFLTEKDAVEWGMQVIGEPNGMPWDVRQLDSPTSCVKQFQTGGLDG